MTEPEIRNSLIGHTITDVDLCQYRQSDSLFDVATLHLNDGSMVVFRSIPPDVETTGVVEGVG